MSLPLRPLPFLLLRPLKLMKHFHQRAFLRALLDFELLRDFAPAFSLSSNQGRSGRR
ncbi:hypothetical protein CHCC20335_4020 [Bacillus paralicheniformis]|nr:hypothetical protein CHCC20335_4020 [Bacillus paralicheniformis]